MFSAELCKEVTRKLPEFSLSKPCNAYGSLPDALHSYLEFYGFYETLKQVPSDFFWGYRSCQAAHHTYRIATCFWRLPHARGTVLLVHGLFDHVGLFQHLIRHCLQSGFAVIAVDLPGHGLSDGAPTAIDDFRRYSEVVADTAHFFRPHCKQPLYGIGQSTGASVLMGMAFESARSHTDPVFERLVFLGPLVRPRKWWLGRLAYRYLGSMLRQIQRSFEVMNSHDEEFHNFLRYHDPLQARYLSTQWVGALHGWVEGFALQPVVHTPTLVVQGTQDRVVDWQFNVAQIQRVFSCVQVNLVEGARHHLANEAPPWRGAIFSSITQFLRGRGGCSPTAEKSAPAPSEPG